MTIPSSARRKVIKARWWESVGDRIVYLDELATSSQESREFYVFNEGGKRLGQIHSYPSRVTTKIKGTRLVRHGVRRTFWSAGGGYWKQHPSQAEAIRELLDKAE